MAQGTVDQAQTVVAAPVLTQELLSELDANPHKMSEQPKAIRDAVKAHMENPTELTSAEAPKTEEVIVQKTEAPKESEDVVKQRIKQEQKSAADAANRDEQKLAAAIARRDKAAAELKKFEELKPEKPPEDYLEDSHQESVHARLTRLEKENEFHRKAAQDREAEEIDALTRSTQTKKEAQLFDEVSELQNDPKFAAIRMKTPFSKANADYAGWLDNLVQLSGITKDSLTPEEQKSPTNAMRNRALEKYESDETFKSSVKVTPPEELPQLYLILEAHDRKRRLGGNLKGHIFEILDEKGILGDVMRRDSLDAARTAANKTAEAIRSKTTDLKTISPDDGIHRSIESDTTITAKSAAEFMANLKHNQNQKPGYRMTPEDKEKLVKIRAFLASQG